MRLIDAEALENEIVKTMRYVPKDAVLDVACMVNRASTIEAKPVVHAHWNYDGEDDWSGMCSWFCSNCGSFIETEEDTLSYGYNFCPHCGAQMDEVASDNNVGSKTEGVKIPVISMEDVPKLMKD